MSDGIVDIQTGWKAHDQALRELDEAEEARDKAGETVPGYEDTPTDDDRREAYEREVHAPAERAAWIAKLEEFRQAAIVNRLMYALRYHMTDPPVRHIWADARLETIELRDGNPPSDTDRPPHLRGLDLVVDPARHGPIKPSLFRAYEHAKRASRFDVDDNRIERVKAALVAEFTKEQP